MSVTDEDTTVELDGPGVRTTDIDDVRESITDAFDRMTWNVTEAALATHATLLIDSSQCMGLVIVGPSGAGKTTALRFLMGNEDQIYQSDDVTPAALVSQSPDKSDEVLAEEVDLLPKIRHKSLLCKDMANWFSGGRETIQSRMSTMANVMDGEGYQRDAGTHGSRGYDGDFSFNLLGASTPLEKRAWQTMGHVGNRLLFHEFTGSDSAEEAADSVFNPTSVGERVKDCQSVVADFLTELWESYGGTRGYRWTSEPPQQVGEHLTFLAKLVRYGRANRNGSTIQREAPTRILASLRDLARGRALLDGRKSLHSADVDVCARVALSTMPKERRPVVRFLLDPDTKGPSTAGDIAAETSVSKPTAGNRMDTVASLGFGSVEEREGDGRGTEEFVLDDDFRWPPELDYPRF